MDNESSNIDIDKVVNYWVISSDDDFKAMNNLFDSKDYCWALFIGHLVIEKLLKAYFTKKNKRHAPFIHNLYRLAELNEIELTEEYSNWLDKITSFNLNTRYDDYKKNFHSLCTEDFANEWIEKIKIIRTWIKQML